MISNIKINLEILEQMLYFWQACSEGEKVDEGYLVKVAEAKEMQLIYDNDLSAAGIRKVLSAITNRERMSDATKREWKFWNNNMWVMEEKLIMTNMVRPIKVLNADALTEKLNAKKDIPCDTVEIVFIPGAEEEYIINENKLIINFFRIKADLWDEDNVTLEGKSVLDYIEEKLLEING